MPLSSQDHRVIFDFSLDRLDVALQAPDGQWLIPHQTFPNNWAGFCELKQLLLTQLVQWVGPTHLTAVGESSGLYWWHAFFHLATNPDPSTSSGRRLAAFDVDLALLNPKHVKRFCQALPEQDPMLIGCYYQSYGVEDFYTFDLRYLPLRQLSPYIRHLQNVVGGRVDTPGAHEYNFPSPHGWAVGTQGALFLPVAGSGPVSSRQVCAPPAVGPLLTRILCTHRSTPGQQTGVVSAPVGQALISTRLLPTEGSGRAPGVTDPLTATLGRPYLKGV